MAKTSTPSSRSILFVNHSMATGGIETLIVDFARHLRDAGFTPRVAVFQGQGSLERDLNRMDIAVHRLEKREGVDLRMVWRLRRLLGECRAAVVHSHNFSTWLYTTLAVHTLGRRVVHVHTEHSNVDFAPRRYWIERLLGRYTDRTVAVSAAVRDVMIRDIGIAPERVALIYNGIDMTRFRPNGGLRGQTRAALGIAPDEIAIGIVARLVPVKDHQTLVASFRLLRERVSRRVRLVLVGDGPERAALAREIAAHDMSAAVMLLGERHDIPALLNALDIYALTSVNEGMNLTLLEAMSTGLPVVATAVGGNPEIVADGETGMLAPARDAAALATAFARLVEDEGRRRRFGEHGRRRVESRFSQSAMLDAYLALYRGGAGSERA